MNKTPAIWLLVALTGLGPFTMQVLVPSLPAMAADFGASNAAAQSTLTLYLAGVAFGQLLYGPASDQFGRRPVLLGGLVLYMLGTLLCTLAPTIGWLAAGRVVQAMGACSGLVLGRAIVRDAFPRDRAASMLGYVMTAMSVAPMVAPLLGAWLDAAFGWRSAMVACLAVGGLVLAMTVWRLRETLAEPVAMAGFSGVLRAYGGLLALPQFRALAAINICTAGVFFAFMGGAPFVVVQGMGRSPHDYATAFLVISLMYMAGSFTAGRLSGRLGAMQMIGIALVITTCGAVAGLALVLALPLALWVVFLPMGVVALGNGMGQPNAIAAAISVRAGYAGTASGLLGALQMGFGAVMTAVVGVFEGGAGIATMAVMAGCGIGAQLALRGARRAA